MECQQLGQCVPQLSAGDDLIHEAVLLQIFRPLKAVGQLLTDGLPDDPGTGKADEAADYIRAAMARSAPEFAPALYEEYDYVALLRASLDRDIEAQKEQNEAQSVIDELIRLRDAGEADGRYYSREQLERYRTEVAPYLIFPSCGYVDGWTPANSYMKGKLDMDGLIAELNGQ